jgi:hypothetical protein
MRTLWRSTASLLRKHPIVWLPVLLTRIISFNLSRIDSIVRTKLLHALMPWLLHSQGHSVLSGNIVVDSPAPVAMRKFVALTAPIQYGTLFLQDFVFACALIAIAAILHRLLTSGHGTLRDAVASISSSSYRILIYCFKLLGLSLIARLVTSFLTPFMDSFINHNGPEKLLLLSPTSQIALGGSPVFIDFFDHLWILPITLCVVYVIAPVELHLLQPPDFPPTPNQRRQARLADMTAAVAISALGIALFAIERNLFQVIHRTDQSTYLISAVSSLARAIPYVPLYIALYLIANPDTPLIATPETPLDLPEPPQSPTNEISL